MAEIIPYHHRYAAQFKKLNLEWLDEYHLTEDHDLMILNDPQREILDQGGEIYLAKESDEIVGTAAIINEGNGVYELAKMSVAPRYQGRGISRLLMEQCLNRAKELHAVKVILFSNSQLTTAISLYEKYGFKHLPADNAPYQSADIMMELVF